ncbi:nitroreductase family protein [Acholeplasma sp. OttesenSCG-928-E16]|nr:nitroreductase family protein [Acholeplasma sp. OttesenSCG-928-E16]
MDYIEFLKNRKSIRKFVDDFKIPRNEMDSILNLAQRAPSSGNMQPWRFIVIETKESKKVLRNVMSGNFLQLDTSSAMILVLYDKNEYDYVTKIYHKAVRENLMPLDVANKQISWLLSKEKTESEFEKLRDGFINVGIVINQLLHSIRAHGYEGGAMRGYDEKRIVSELGLDSNRYLPAAIIAVGKKASDAFDTIRLDLSDTVIYK